MGKKLNLIMITIDGARVDRIMQFKSFQQLKSLGSFFSQVITYAPYTIGSMHAIFTGTYGPKTGVNNYYGSRSFKKDRYLTLPGILQKEGYVTIGDIINDLIVPKEGFDDLKVHDELKDDLTLRHCDLLERVKKLNDNDHNYFLYLHYSNIHTEIMKNVLKKYTNFSKEYFVKRIENLAAYDRYIAKADDYLTAIINKIYQLALDENSLIVVQSDHGIGTGEKFGERAYGAFCYDYTVKAFTYFIFPGVFPKKEFTNLIRTIDATPTILDALQIKDNFGSSEMDGKSVIPLMKGIEKKPRTAFIEAGNPGKTGEPPKQPNVRAIRTDKWKYIRNYFDETEELYDLESDSTESNNLIKTETFVASELRQALNKELNSYYKGIIIAAGKSERLRPLTDHIPKCLLEVDGKPMLEHTLDNFKWNNIKNLSVIRGYKKEKINYPGHKYYDDNIQNGILSSLMHAKDEMHGPFVAVYSDIMFEKEILSELLETKGDIVISTDVDWKKNYHDRSDHPLDEAEKVIFEDDKVKDIGKHILSSHANGEFVGLVKFSARGAKVLREIYEKSKRTYRYTPFQKAPEFEKAYLTDIIKEMVDQGFEVRISKIKNRWVEFDTVQDYQKVQNGPGVLK